MQQVQIVYQKFTSLFEQYNFEATLPQFENPWQLDTYKSWLRRSISVEMTLLLLITTGIFNVFARFICWIFALPQETNPRDVLGQYYEFPLIMESLVHLAMFYILRKFSRTAYHMLSTAAQRIFAYDERLVLRCQLEEWLMFGAVVINALIFLARIGSSPCLDEKAGSLWFSQEYFSVDKCSFFPHDAALMLYMPPLAFQIIWMGVSYEYILAGYCACFAVAGCACYAVRTDIQSHCLLYGLGIAVISFELERALRNSFLKRRRFHEPLLVQPVPAYDYLLEWCVHVNTNYGG